MKFTSQILTTIILFIEASILVTAQTYNERVWGVFAYTIHGDRTPNILVAESGSRRLTDYGASQLQAAGSAFRGRYVPPGNSYRSQPSAIEYLSPYFLDPQDIDAFSTTDQYNIASAQSFMLGLYPPLAQYDMNQSSTTASGNKYTPPLNGYQFPRIVTLGESDPSSVAIQGSAQCGLHQAAEYEYGYSNEALKITENTAAFYVDLWWRLLSHVYNESSATYTNAVDISDYLEYEALHNSSIWSATDKTELSRVRWLADQYVFATNAQNVPTARQSTFGVVNPIAGQTLASSVLRAFDMNIQNSGAGQKMTLLFGGDEPAVALASLLGLASQQQPNFYSRPVRGASLVFELYSYETDKAGGSYPSIDDLFVRFLLHNGTSPPTEFVPYPLFGASPSLSYIPYTEFRSELRTFAMLSVGDWCIRCNSQAIFCNGVLGGDSSVAERKHRVAPTVAGVIGAVVTLVVIGLLAGLGFLLTGWRKRGGRGRSKPSLGGFKGNDKLASDTDVAFRNSVCDAAKSAEAEQSNAISAEGIVFRGHERLGSWEMGQGQQGKEGDEIGLATTSPLTTQRHHSETWRGNEEEWQIHSGLQPVKIRETV